MGFFAFLYTQVAGWSCKISHFNLSKGRFLWNESTAVFTPDSARILNAISCAALEASGVIQKDIAWASLSLLRSLYGIGEGPAPAVATILPQNG